MKLSQTLYLSFLTPTGKSVSQCQNEVDSIVKDFLWNWRAVGNSKAPQPPSHKPKISSHVLRIHKEAVSQFQTFQGV